MISSTRVMGLPIANFFKKRIGSDIERFIVPCVLRRTAPIPLPGVSSGIGGRTPFTADIYYINLKNMPQIGWGTNP
ncbi:MAG: hypothetical protein AAFV93_16135, partial [Chloroflexota bacterium]